MRVLHGFRILPSRLKKDVRTVTTSFSTPARGVRNVIPLLCRDNCFAVGSCGGLTRLCALSVPGNRVQVKLVHDLLPNCLTRGALGNGAAVTHVCLTVTKKSVSKTLHLLRRFLSAIPCYSGAGCRKRCRRLFCVVFSLFKVCISIRIHAPGKHISIIVHITNGLCIVRLGLNESTRTTVTRVGLGRCPRHFSLDKLRIIGIKVGFSIRGRALKS